MGNVNSWRKWLWLDSGDDLPESAVAIFRTVQANWAAPKKISGERPCPLIVGHDIVLLISKCTRVKFDVGCIASIWV